jgi:hypothetical protein
MSGAIRVQHLARKTVLYVRQSSGYQVNHNLESQNCSMRCRTVRVSWTRRKSR